MRPEGSCRRAPREESGIRHAVRGQNFAQPDNADDLVDAGAVHNRQHIDTAFAHTFQREAYRMVGVHIGVRRVGRNQLAQSRRAYRWSVEITAVDYRDYEVTVAGRP